MARSHLGEREFRTYAAWKRAIKKLAPEARFEGDKDIANAYVIVGLGNQRKGLGEWDGAVGVIYSRAEGGYRSNPSSSWHAKRVAALEARLAKASHKDQKLLILGGLSEQRASVRASKHLRVANPPKRLRGYVRVDRKNPEREWHSEWRTTYNIISKRAQNELDRMYYEGKRDANAEAVQEEDRRIYSGRERRHSNPRKRKRMRRNCNPRKGAVEIYSNVLAIEARKGKGSLWPNEKFRHGFKSKSVASVYGLPDGSLHIKSKAGKRLWKKFKYKKGVDY